MCIELLTYKSRPLYLQAFLTRVLWLKTFLEMLIGKLSHVSVWKYAIF